MKRVLAEILASRLARIEACLNDFLEGITANPFNKYYFSRRVKTKRVGDKTYRYLYIEVYAQGRRGSHNARLAARARSENELRPYIVETLLHDVVAKAMALRSLVEELKEELDIQKRENA